MLEYLCLNVFFLKLSEKKNPVWKLDSQVAELESSLDAVKVLLEQQSPTVHEAQHLLKVSACSLVIFAPENSSSGIVNIEWSFSCSPACMGQAGCLAQSPDAPGK